MKISLTLPSDSEDSNNSGDESSSDLEEGEEGDLMQDDLTGSRIVDISILKSQICSKLVCRFCHSTVNLSESKRRGLGSTFCFVCPNGCEEQDTFTSCKTDESNFKNYTVNKRAVFAMRCIGADRAELQTFCGLMDMP